MVRYVHASTYLWVHIGPFVYRNRISGFWDVLLFYFSGDCYSILKVTVTIYIPYGSSMPHSDQPLILSYFSHFANV